jgi:hypothetical protein
MEKENEITENLLRISTQGEALQPLKTNLQQIK